MFVCWQELARNPWMRVPLARRGAATLPPPPPPAPGAPGPFAFADPARLRGILDGAGFRDVAIDPFESPLESAGAGGTLDQAVAAHAGPGAAGGWRCERPSAALRPRVDGAVREALAPHATPAGVKLGCAAWIVRAV